MVWIQTAGRDSQHQAPITRLLVSPRGDSLVSIDRAGGCIWWNLGNARPLQTWKLSVQRTNNLQFLDDRTAVVGGLGAMVVVRLGEQAPTVVKPETRWITLSRFPCGV